MAITLLQHASTTATFTSGTTGTVSPAFGSNTTAGSCLAACISVSSASIPSISSVTTNGTAENWAQAVTDTDAVVFGWADPGTGGGQKTIDVNVSFGETASTSSSVAVMADIFEVSGVQTVKPVDKTAAADVSTAGTSWSSGATGTTGTATEMWLGFALTAPTTANTTATVTGPGGAWTNETTLATSWQNGGTGSSHKFNVYQQSGYQIVSSTGAATYAGTTSQTSDWFAAVLTLAAPATATLTGAGTLTPAGYIAGAATLTGAGTMAPTSNYVIRAVTMTGAGTCIPGAPTWLGYVSMQGQGTFKRLDRLVWNKTLIVSAASAPGVDSYGNTYVGGLGVYGGQGKLVSPEIDIAAGGAGIFVFQSAGPPAVPIVFPQQGDGAAGTLLPHAADEEEQW